MREQETYRMELEQITKYFNGKHILTVSDVATYCGRSREWCRVHLGVTGSGCTAVQLANILSKM